MRRNLAFRRRYQAAQAQVAQLRLAQVKTNAVIIRTASDNKAIGAEIDAVAAGIPADLATKVSDFETRISNLEATP